MIIQCNECGFSVSENMKFALKTNACPSCGLGLFSDEDSVLIQTFQTELGSQQFTFNLTEQNIYDIALFIFNQCKYGTIRQLIEDEVRGGYSGIEETIETPTEATQTTFEDERVQLRKEIESEFKDELSGLIEDDQELDGVETDEDIFSKAERLKRLHQHRRISTNTQRSKISPNKNTGTRVRRSSDD